MKKPPRTLVTLMYRPSQSRQAEAEREIGEADRLAVAQRRVVPGRVHEQDDDAQHQRHRQDAPHPPGHQRELQRQHRRQREQREELPVAAVLEPKQELRERVGDEDQRRLELDEVAVGGEPLGDRPAAPDEELLVVGDVVVIEALVEDQKHIGRDPQRQQRRRDRQRPVEARSGFDPGDQAVAALPHGRSARGHRGRGALDDQRPAASRASSS